MDEKIVRHFIRKPKFMRNEGLMRERIEDAKVIWKRMASKSYVDYELYEQYRACIESAAKAAGFFRTKDFIEWAISEKISLK